MSKTPRTDEQINGKPCTRFEVLAGDCLRDAYVPSQFARQLEEELAAAHAEIKELNDKLDDAVAESTNAVNDIIRIKWQRDRLAEAIEKYLSDDYSAAILQQALQSLSTNTPDHTSDLTK